MKYISKGIEHSRVTQWKMAAQPPTWEKLNRKSKIKKLVRESLLEEQGYICCYCQRRIHESETINGQQVITAEIEHIISRHECDQSNQPLLKIEHSNLIASCDGNKRKRNQYLDPSERHCNNYKGNEQLPISPLSPTCESNFDYDFSGNIHASGVNQLAQQTISTLNLDKLYKERLSKIKGIFYEIDGITPIDFQNNEKNLLLNFYQSKSNIDNDAKMKYPEFSAVIVNLLNQI